MIRAALLLAALALVCSAAVARAQGAPAAPDSLGDFLKGLADSTDASSQWRQVWLRTLGEDVLETWAEPSDALQYLPEITPADGDIVIGSMHDGQLVAGRDDPLLDDTEIRSWPAFLGEPPDPT